MKKRTILDIIEAKNRKKLVCITAYTYPVAKLIAPLDYDIILIGDSLAMTIQGYDNTLEVTMDDILYHSKAVVKAKTNAFIVADMPFLSTDISPEKSIANAGLLIQKAGVDAVKIEGGKNKTGIIKRIVEAGIPVMGHIGLTPQKILNFGKYSVHGKNPGEEMEIIEAAKSLEESGVFSIVLECMPYLLAKKVSEAIRIPTIGIGAGRYCDGQILVIDDIFGMETRFKPKFVKIFGNVKEVMEKALIQYKKEVEEGSFPDEEHSYQ